MDNILTPLVESRENLYTGSIPMQKDCVFCKIVAGEIPSRKEYEDEHILAFHDINPVAPIHLLIIPKKHIENIAAASADDMELIGKLQLTAAEMARKMGIDKSFRILTANGKGAGQSVFHLHYHLIGGWKKAPEMEADAGPGGLRPKK